MASTYTALGVELMATGENAGTWGTKTNTNLNIIEQISGGFTAQSIAGGAQTTTLSVSDGSAGATLAHRMIEFTGSISGNQIVTIPLDVQTFYFLRNSTSGAYTVQFKYVSGSGDSFTFSATDKGDAVLFATANDGTNPDIYTLPSGTGDGDVTLTGTQTLTNKTLTSPKIGTSILDTNGAELFSLTATGSATNEFTIANAANGSAPSIAATGSSDSNIDIAIKPKGTGETVFGTGSANATITSSGAHDLILDTNSGTNSGTITITDAANGDITIAPNGTGVAKAVDSADATGAIKIAGKETIWIPAVAMYPSTTGGAPDPETIEITADANRPVLKAIAFDKDSDEYAQFSVAFPKSWNEGTVTFQPFFTANTTNTGSAKFMVKGVAISSDGAISTDFGTAQGTAIGFSGTAYDLMVGNESSAITIAGSPAAGDQVFFAIFRDVSADNLSADALLLGVKMHFTTDAANDA